MDIHLLLIFLLVKYLDSQDQTIQLHFFILYIQSFKYQYSENSKQQNPKYLVQLGLTSKSYWIAKNCIVWILLQGQNKIFSTITKELQQIKDLIQCKIMQKDIISFYSSNSLLLLLNDCFHQFQVY
ncbi:unnamed protein product [Paramecium sonneborni]|uniref:Transmembrane protein n=1 Tax=Paramecium sonneborni TaxID=65129 RepID=A0A8S1RLH9_9CILI|nr:unnamed protein product [Paramecium sonneborni]